MRAYASHNIDFLRWTLGEITDASAALRTAIAERPDADGHAHRCTAETGFTATMRTETGVSIAIDSTATAAVERPNRVIVIGSDGILEMRSDSVHEIGGWIELHTREGTSEPFRLEQAGDNHRARDDAVGANRSRRGAERRRGARLTDLRRRPRVCRRDGPPHAARLATWQARQAVSVRRARSTA